MRKLGISQLFIVLSMIIFLSGCQVVEAIFKAGVWAGIISVVLVVLLVIFLIKKIF